MIMYPTTKATTGSTGTLSCCTKAPAVEAAAPLEVVTLVVVEESSAAFS